MVVTLQIITRFLLFVDTVAEISGLREDNICAVLRPVVVNW